MKRMALEAPWCQNSGSASWCHWREEEQNCGAETKHIYITWRCVRHITALHLTNLGCRFARFEIHKNHLFKINVRGNYKLSFDTFEEIPHIEGGKNATRNWIMQFKGEKISRDSSFEILIGRWIRSWCKINFFIYIFLQKNKK